MAVQKYNYKYLGDYPRKERTQWREDLQGVTHDRDHWFFTQQNRLWRIPVTHDLCEPLDEHKNSVGIPGPLRPNYDHFGDLDHRDGFLFIPLTPNPPIIAVFRASDLAYIGCSPLASDAKAGNVQNDAGWCAVNPRNGDLYTSNKYVSLDDPLFVYTVDYAAIQSENRVEPFAFKGRFKVHSSDGSSLTLKYMQGGAISDDGILYTMSGYYNKNCDPEVSGIHVFDLASGNLITQSSCEHGDFKYEFHPGLRAEEPEGLTLWDLNDGRAKNIRGKLHALMLNNGINDRWDEVYFKHYDIVPR